jgi:hypothetical protein
MKGRFFKVICAVVMSIGLFGQANASLIPGGIYQDVDGLEWEYVGSFDLGAGPKFDVATPYSGLAAAAFAIYADVNVPDTLALAAYQTSTYYNDIKVGATVVNHLAWYDSYWTGNQLNRPAIERLAEGKTAEGGGKAGKYDAIGDVSAYVEDRTLPGSYTNYVFKAVEVPGPSTLGIFALALLGLGVRKFKR